MKHKQFFLKKIMFPVPGVYNFVSRASGHVGMLLNDSVDAFPKESILEGPYHTPRNTPAGLITISDNVDNVIAYVAC